jgi:hypothetical protein
MQRPEVAAAPDGPLGLTSPRSSVVTEDHRARIQRTVELANPIERSGNHFHRRDRAVPDLSRQFTRAKQTQF